MLKVHAVRGVHAVHGKSKRKLNSTLPQWMFTKRKLKSTLPQSIELKLHAVRMNHILAPVWELIELLDCFLEGFVHTLKVVFRRNVWFCCSRYHKHTHWMLQQPCLTQVTWPLTQSGDSIVWCPNHLASQWMSRPHRLVPKVRAPSVNVEATSTCVQITRHFSKC